MADDIFATLSPNDLAGFSQSVQASDPYGMAGRSLGQSQFDMSTWSAPTQGIASFGKAFLSGLLQNQARSNAANQLSSVVNVLPQLGANPYMTAAPEGVDSGAFAALRGSAILNKAQSEAASKSKLADMLQAVGIAQATERAKTIGAGEGKAALYGDLSKDPDGPQYKINQDILKEEDAARTEIAKMPSVTQFNAMQKALPLVKAFKDADTKSSDMGFVYNYVKALDDTAVRNEEINMASSSNPLIQQYRATLEGALTGKSALTPALKNQMYAELQGGQKNIYAQALLDAQKRFNIAEARGVKDFNKVLNFDPNLTFGNVANSEAVQSTQGAAEIIAAVKAQYGNTPEAKRIAQEQIKALSIPRTSRGAPLG